MASVLFDIVGRDKASAAFNSAGGAADGLKKKLGEVAKLAAGAFAAGGIVKFGADSVKAAQEAQVSQEKLSDAYARFPALASVNRSELDKLNTSLAAKTRFDDDATAAAEAQLAQFGLTGEQVRQLTPLLQDYAAKTGKDLPDAATDLGKAVLGQGRALKAIGLDLKDTGDRTGNFTQLIGGLRSQVGGFAEKEGKTAAGRAEIMKNQFGELEESVGRALLPTLTKLANFLATKLIPWLQGLGKFVGDHKDEFIAFGIGIAVALVPAFIGWATAAAAAAVATLIAAAPVIALGAAVAALAAGVIYAYKHWGFFHDAVDAVARFLRDTLWPAIQSIVRIITDYVVPVIAKEIWFYGKLIGIYADVVVAIYHLVRDGITFLVDKFLAAVEWIIKGAASAFGWIPGIGGKLRDAAKDFEAFRDKVNATLSGIQDKVVTVTVLESGTGGAFKGLPTYAGGGVKIGDGLAFLHDKEAIFTPDQLRVLTAGLALAPREGLQDVLGGATLDGRGGIKIEHLDVHNPVPEPASESVPRQLRKLSLSLGLGL